MKTKVTRKRLAAMLIAGPLCLAACGDDSPAPQDPNNNTGGSGSIVIPVDSAPVVTTVSEVIQTTPEGAVAQDVVVGTPLRDGGGSSTNLRVAQGAMLYDEAGLPVVGAQLNVELVSYNSNANGGIAAYKQSRSPARQGGERSPRATDLSSMLYVVGAVEVKITAGNRNIVRIEGGTGRNSGSTISRCGNSLGVFTSADVYQENQAGSYDTVAVGVPVSSGEKCVTVSLPSKLNSTSTRAAGIVINGNPATGGLGKH